MNTPPPAAANVPVGVATTLVKPPPRRSKRQAEAVIGTRRSQRALKRRHDSRTYGEDYGILPSD